MSHNLNLRSQVLLVAVLALAVSQVACDRASPCTRGDLLASMDPSFREALQGEEMAWRREELEWMRDAKECRVGQYLVIGPASGEDDTIFVLREQQVVFASGSGHAMMYMDGLPLAQLGERNTTPARPWFSYDARDATSKATITVMDKDLDGQPDIRMRYVKGQKMSVEVWDEDRWRAMVRRNGQSGFMRDGQFVPHVPTQLPPPDGGN